MASQRFTRNTIRRIMRALQKRWESDDLSQRDGLLQKLDPRVKIIALIGLAAAVAWTGSLVVFPIILAIALALAIASKVPLRSLLARVWVPVFAFTGAIALPALFLVPGRVLFETPLTGWTVSAQGLRSAILLLARAETATTLSALLVLTTPWMHVLKGLRVLGVPVVLVVVLSMAYRYIHVLLLTAQELFEARESRLVGKLNRREGRRVGAATAGVLLSKTMYFSEEVYLAMRSRGYAGEVHVMADFRMNLRDWLSLAAVTITIALIFIPGMK